VFSTTVNVAVRSELGRSRERPPSWRRGLALALAILTSALASARAEAAPLSMQRALEIGRSRSPEIHGATFDADAQRAQVRVARAGYYPSIKGNLTGQYQITSTEQALPPPTNGSTSTMQRSVAGLGSIGANWVAYDFGRTSAAVRAADSQLEAAHNALATAVLSFDATVANSFLGAVYAAKIRLVADATLKQRTAIAKIAAALVRAGLQPPVEELRRAARVELAKQDLALAEAAAIDTRLALAGLLEVEDHEVRELLEPSFATAPLRMRTLTNVSDLPVVRGADAAADARAALSDVADAQYLPSLSLFVNAVGSITRNDTAPDNTRLANVVGGMQVSMAIFDPGIAPTAARAREQERAARAFAARTRRDARSEASRAFAACIAAHEVLSHARDSHHALASVYRLVEARYETGLSTPIELVEAETAENLARLFSVQTELLYALAVIRVYVANNQSVEDLT